MLNFSSHKLILLTIKILLVFTPLYSFAEVIAFIDGTVINQTEALTPIYIKLIKDLGFLFIILMSSISILKRKKISRVFIYCIPFGFLTIVSFLLSYSQNPILAVAGLRWILPIFLLFFLVNKIEDMTMRDINRILSFLLVISFSLQIYQLFNASKWFGANQIGQFELAARTSGIFFLPNTSAFFVCMCVFFNLFFTEKPNYLLLLIACFSIFLTASGTGIIVLFLLLLIMFATKTFKKSSVKRLIILSTPLILLILPILFSVLLVITGRGSDYVEISGGGRWNIFVDSLNGASLLSSEFGAGSNSGVLLSSNQDVFNNSRIVDSTYAAIVVNTGLLGTLIFLIFILGWINFVFRYKQVDAICFTLIYVLFSFTTNITEAFPMNLLFAVVAAYYISSQTKTEQVYG